MAVPVAEEIVRRFDQDAPAWYDAQDRANGWVEVMNRRGELQRFPLLTVSIGIASTERRSFHHYAEAVAVATEMKQFTKAAPGSSWALDRRSGQ
jgi:hypothetical protein